MCVHPQGFKPSCVVRVHESLLLFLTYTHTPHPPYPSKFVIRWFHISSQVGGREPISIFIPWNPEEADLTPAGS